MGLNLTLWFSLLSHGNICPKSGIIIFAFLKYHSWALLDMKGQEKSQHWTQRDSITQQYELEKDRAWLVKMGNSLRLGDKRMDFFLRQGKTNVRWLLNEYGGKRRGKTQAIYQSFFNKLMLLSLLDWRRRQVFCIEMRTFLRMLSKDACGASKWRDSISTYIYRLNLSWKELA